MVDELKGWERYAGKVRRSEMPVRDIHASRLLKRRGRSEIRETKLKRPNHYVQYRPTT